MTIIMIDHALVNTSFECYDVIIWQYCTLSDNDDDNDD